MTKNQAINILYWIAIVAIGTYIAYAKGWILADFESITPQQAQTILQQDSNTLLLDVRTQEEFAKEHIEGATLIPVQVLNQKLTQLQSAKDKKIVVYCFSGTRSLAASRILRKNGFTPLNVKGGISQWKNDGLSLNR